MGSDPELAELLAKQVSSNGSKYYFNLNDSE